MVDYTIVWPNGEYTVSWYNIDTLTYFDTLLRLVLKQDKTPKKYLIKTSRKMQEMLIEKKYPSVNEMVEMWQDIKWTT